MKVLIIDNYDSFTYNLYQYAGQLLEDSEIAFKLDVCRNDELSLEAIRQGNYDRIIVSPGPGEPSDPAYFGVCAKVITELGPEIPLLGVCLGMQGIAHYYGGKVVRAAIPMHGKTSQISHDEKGIFKGLPVPLEVMRYHSLIVAPESIPDCLEVSATTEAGEIMGLRHKDWPIEGIQFHPESFATEAGMLMLQNFLFDTWD